eukprot:scaffold732_cov60-Phaeocystis_antarctica.AAC.7
MGRLAARRSCWPAEPQAWTRCLAPSGRPSTGRLPSRCMCTPRSPDSLIAGWMERRKTRAHRWSASRRGPRTDRRCRSPQPPGSVPARHPLVRAGCRVRSPTRAAAADLPATLPHYNSTTSRWAAP